MTRRSGLLVPVPEAEPLVAEWRTRFDPPATVGVPAHVTVLYPFVPPDRIDRGTEESIRGALAERDAFAFTFTHVDRFEDEVLYLAPEPTEPFVELTTVLVRAFPDHLPYGGRFTEVVPHLTVADTPDAPYDVLTERLAAGLPLDGKAREVHLMVEDRDGFWSTRSVFPLNGART